MLLFGDDYQLFPVIDEGAIQGYSRTNSKVPQTPTTRMTPSQLILQRGNYLFTHVMSETVFALDITIFFETEAGNALAALCNIHEGDSHILK